MDVDRNNLVFPESCFEFGILFWIDKAVMDDSVYVDNSAQMTLSQAQNPDLNVNEIRMYVRKNTW